MWFLITYICALLYLHELIFVKFIRIYLSLKRCLNVCGFWGEPVDHTVDRSAGRPSNRPTCNNVHSPWELGDRPTACPCRILRFQRSKIYSLAVYRLVNRLVSLTSILTLMASSYWAYKYGVFGRVLHKFFKSQFSHLQQSFSTSF